MTQIADVMTLGAHSLPPDATVLAAAYAMATLDVGAIPVWDGLRLVGIVTDRDLVLRVLAAGRPAASTLLREVMTEDPCWCHDTQSLDEAAERMRALQVRRLPILDREQRLVGMLTLGDMAVRGDEAAAGRALEEVSEPAAPARVT